MSCCPVPDQGSMGLPSGLGLDVLFSEWLDRCLAIVLRGLRGPKQWVQSMSSLFLTGTVCLICQCAAVV